MCKMKPIHGYDGKYLVDERGVVYTIKRRGTSGGIVAQRLNSTGYWRVDLQKGKTKRSVFVHRLVAEAFIPKKEGCDYVNHKDGNKRNNNVSNLEWCTRSENVRHAYATGLMHGPTVSGEKHHNSKLTDEEAIEIYKLCEQGISGLKVAAMYGVNKKAVYQIHNGVRKLSCGMTVKQYMNS